MKIIEYLFVSFEIFAQYYILKINPHQLLLFHFHNYINIPLCEYNTFYVIILGCMNIIHNTFARVLSE